MLRNQGILCVLDMDDLRELIREEAYRSRYSIHPDATKMYCELRETYWWNGTKRDIADLLLNAQIANKSKRSIKRRVA